MLREQPNPLIVDVCAGRGSLAAAALRILDGTPSVSLIETNGSLLSVGLSICAGSVVGPRQPTDLFSPQALPSLKAADAVMINPPFAGTRGKSLGQKLADMQKDAGYPDLACHYLIYISKIVAPGTPVAFILRRDAFTSRAYQKFCNDLMAAGSVHSLVDVARRLRPGSGAAEAVIGVFVVGGRSTDCLLRRNLSVARAREHRLLRHGWRRLGDSAQVRAGPSIKSELRESKVHDAISIKKVIDIPRNHDGSILWSSDFTYMLKWEPKNFSVLRNLKLQGRAGVVYRLAGSEFRTAIMPNGFHFTSATPAIFPKREFDFNFIVGCSLIPAWRKLVRNWIGSFNFTPSAVEDVYVPFNVINLYRSISELGELAFCQVRLACRHQKGHVDTSSKILKKIEEIEIIIYNHINMLKIQ